MKISPVTSLIQYLLLPGIILLTSGLIPVPVHAEETEDVSSELHLIEVVPNHSQAVLPYYLSDSSSEYIVDSDGNITETEGEDLYYAKELYGLLCSAIEDNLETEDDTSSQEFFKSANDVSNSPLVTRVSEEADRIIAENNEIQSESGNTFFLATGSDGAYEIVSDDSVIKDEDGSWVTEDGEPVVEMTGYPDYLTDPGLQYSEGEMEPEEPFTVALHFSGNSGSDREWLLHSSRLNDIASFLYFSDDADSDPENGQPFRISNVSFHVLCSYRLEAYPDPEDQVIRFRLDSSYGTDGISYSLEPDYYLGYPSVAAAIRNTNLLPARLLGDMGRTVRYTCMTPAELSQDPDVVSTADILFFNDGSCAKLFLPFYKAISGKAMPGDSFSNGSSSRLSWTAAYNIYTRAIAENNPLIVCMPESSFSTVDGSSGIYKLCRMLFYFQNPADFQLLFDNELLTDQNHYFNAGQSTDAKLKGKAGQLVVNQTGTDDWSSPDFENSWKNYKRYLRLGSINGKTRYPDNHWDLSGEDHTLTVLKNNIMNYNINGDSSLEQLLNLFTKFRDNVPASGKTETVKSITLKQINGLWRDGTDSDAVPSYTFLYSDFTNDILKKLVKGSGSDSSKSLVIPFSLEGYDADDPTGWSWTLRYARKIKGNKNTLPAEKTLTCRRSLETRYPYEIVIPYDVLNEMKSDHSGDAEISSDHVSVRIHFLFWNIFRLH